MSIRKKESREKERIKKVTKDQRDKKKAEGKEQKRLLDTLKYSMYAFGGNLMHILLVIDLPLNIWNTLYYMQQVGSHYTN